MTKKATLLLPMLLIFLPFLLLCRYNQPVGDDMWYTWMAKRYGIVEAQYQWFITLNGRYSASLFMSLNSWVHGSTISFKIWPAIVMLAWIGVVAAVVRTITSKAVSSFYCLIVSLLLTCCYYLCMPDLHEGTYWMSAVTGYQIPLLLYLCCWLLFNGVAAGKWKRIVLLSLLLIVTGGFHELIAGMAFTLCAYVVVLRRFLYKTPFAKWLLAALVLLIPILIQVFCTGNQYKASLTAGKIQLPFLRILRISVTQTGSYLASACLLSPAFWLMPVVAWLIAFRYLRSKWVLLQPLRINLLIVALFTLFFTFLPGLINVFIDKGPAPLRIINLSVFVFITGCMVGAGLYGIQGPTYGLLYKTANSAKYSYLLLVIALFCAGILSDNERAVVQALVNGSAQQYDKEVQQRFQQIEACKADTCTFSCLKHQPPVLSPGDVCRNTHPLEHLSKVYNKTLVVNNEE